VKGDWGLGLFVFIFVLVILSPFIYIYYRFLRTLRDLLRAVSEQNRGMSPGLVWLNWIPVFNMAWAFVTIVKIREAARKEFASRGVREDGGEGFGVGLASAITWVLSGISAPPSAIQNENAVWTFGLISGLLTLASFVCWILYWMRMANLRDMLVNTMGARPFSPEDVRYQPQPWHTPPQMSPSPQASQPPPQAPPATQYQGEQHPQFQSGPWLGAQHFAAAMVICASCGAVGQPQGGICGRCGRSVNPASTGQQASGVGPSPTAPAPTAATAPATGTAPAASGAPEAVAASSTAKCPYCGTLYRAEAGFCSSCGRPVQR